MRKLLSFYRITKDPSIHVYNCSTADIKSISMAEVAEMGVRFMEKIPLEGAIWKPSITIARNKVVYYLLTLILHIIPALFIDAALKLSGRKPM